MRQPANTSYMDTQRQPEKFLGYTDDDDHEPIYQPEICRCGQEVMGPCTPDDAIDTAELMVEYADVFELPRGRFLTDVSITD